jgi:hypothetical protein
MGNGDLELGILEKGYSDSRLPGSKGRPVRKADNLTAICEPIV